MRLIWVLFLFISQAWSADIYVSSLLLPDVQAAVSSAQTGDIVILPSGSETWSDTLLIRTALTLKGQGSNSTTIVSGIAAGGSAFDEGNYLIHVNPFTSELDELFRITGIELDLDSSSGGIILENRRVQAMRKVRIDHIHMHDSVLRGIILSGTVYGCIDSSAFYRCSKTMDSYGMQRTSWDNLTFDFGTADNMYFEDNFVSGGGFTSCGHGGRYALRYNNYIINDRGGFENLFDAHGNQENGIYGTMGIEIYRNHIISYQNSRFLDHRGGKAMVYNNQVIVVNDRHDSQVREEYSDAISPTTSLQPQHVSDSYYFNNFTDGTYLSTYEKQDCCDAIAENESFWQYTPSFDGSVGVGVGTLAARPVTCVPGVGYWVTDAIPATSVSSEGVFYRCVAPDVWEEYYQPYEYPHPLRDEVVFSGPHAPMNLTLESIE